MPCLTSACYLWVGLIKLHLPSTHFNKINGTSATFHSNCNTDQGSLRCNYGRRRQNSSIRLLPPSSWFSHFTALSARSQTFSQSWAILISQSRLAETFAGILMLGFVAVGHSKFPNAHKPYPSDLTPPTAHSPILSDLWLP